MDDRPEIFVRTVRKTGFICAAGTVIGAFVMEAAVGNGEGAFLVLLTSPLLALLGGMAGIFLGGWIAAFREAWLQRGIVDDES
jgi:hypothetical protein